MPSAYNRTRALLGRRQQAAPAPFVPVPAPTWYWKFDDTLTPAIGADVLTGSAVYGAGKFANGLAGGTSGVISNETPIVTGDFNGEYAVSFWTTRPSAAGGTIFRQFGAAGTGGSELRLRYFFNNPTSAFQYNIGAYQSTIQGSGIPNDGLPHHVCLVVSGGVALLYTDGSPITLGIDLSAELGSFDPGGELNLSASGTGLIDDCAVWVGLGNLPTADDILRIATATGDLSTLLA